MMRGDMGAIKAPQTRLRKASKERIGDVSFRNATGSEFQNF
jgi:hypothetical protein